MPENNSAQKTLLVSIKVVHPEHMRAIEQEFPLADLSGVQKFLDTAHKVVCQVAHVVQHSSINSNEPPAT
jgi:hypothetical protein